MKDESKTARQYIQFIALYDIRSIEDIAQQVQKSQEQVKQDIQYLIEKGFLGTAIINTQTNRIEFPEDRKQKQQVKSQAEEGALQHLLRLVLSPARVVERTTSLNLINRGVNIVVGF